MSRSDLVHPVLHGDVAHAFVQGVGREHQDEVARSLHTLDQLLLKASSLQLLHIDEHAVATQLKMHLQQATEGERERERWTTGGSSKRKGVQEEEEF